MDVKINKVTLQGNPFFEICFQRFHFKYFKVIYFLFFCFSFIDVKAQPNQRDTSIALVQYGSEYLLDDHFYQASKLEKKIDSSIINFPDQKADLEFVKKIFGFYFK